MPTSNIEPHPGVGASPFRVLLLRLIARPVARFFAGADMMGPGRLPTTGPAIVVANHNSHVDTLVLLAVFPASVLARVRPVAAADYFLINPALSWFARRIIGITPVARGVARDADVLAPAKAALARGDILVIFPEGTRGSADELAPLKAGVARLAEAFPDAPVVPVWIQGAGRVLPKGSFIPVPMNCCVVVGEAVPWSGHRTAFMEALKTQLGALRDAAPPLKWS
jgi:1-acyl-sn-glycerol-3-phosphate acyltransferase